MPHLHTGPGQHDQTVSIYLVNLAGEEPRLWLHRHRVSIRWFQAGGHIEHNETNWETLIHELREETGYDISQVAVLQPSPHFAEFHGQNYPLPIIMRSHTYDNLDHYHDDAVYAFVTEQDPAYSLAADESQATAWFTLTQLMDLPDDDIGPDVKVIGRALLLSHTSWDQVPTNSYGFRFESNRPLPQTVLSERTDTLTGTSARELTDGHPH